MRNPKKLEIVTSTPDGNSFTSAINHYDEKGNVVENIEFEEDGSIHSKIIAKYDDEGRQLEEIIWLDGEPASEHKKFIRKPDGSLERTEISYEDGSTSIQYMKKDEANHIEEWIEEDEDGELETRELVKYDDKGNILSREVFDYRNKLKEAFEFEYGDNGLLVERRQLDNKRKLMIVTEYGYDDDKNLIFRANRNRKGVLSDFVKIEYDDKGQVVKQNISGKYTFVFEYDSQGRTVLEERYLAGQQMEYQSRFEYDEAGRMTKEVNLGFTKTFNYEFFD